MSRTKERLDKGALELIDEAVHLLRTSPIHIVLCYYIGSLPFVLSLLYFWTDMARNAHAQNYCPQASLGLAILFVWMKCWQAVFTRKLRSVINLKPLPGWKLQRFLNLVTIQTFTHALGLILLPLSVICMVPFAWTYAFFQNALVFDEHENKGLGILFSESWRHASLWPGQNHLLLIILPFFGIFIFINLAIGLFLVPHLMDRLLGIQTLFTISGSWALNTTFFAIAFGLTYLCIDPLIKTVYMLRCFYGKSLQSGDDLKAGLKHLFHKSVSIGLLLIIVGLSLPIHSAIADQAGGRPEYASTPKPAATVQEIDRSIEATLENRKFAWRLPRIEPQKEEPNGPFAQLMEWLLKGLEDAVGAIAKAVIKIIDWIREAFPAEDHTKDTDPLNKGWMDSVRILVLILLGVLAAVLAVWLHRIIRKRKAVVTARVLEPIRSMPDITDEDIDASELPADRWLALARELMEKGSLRLAMRAFYLAILAHLADREMISLAGYKSNRDYKRELNRRAHDQQDLISQFALNVAAIDRAWYGMHPVDQPDLQRFVENQERIMAFV